ncbi:MAG: LysR family transcriptional regulator [Ferrovum sp.]|nr:LysR family transcriptional regulator [Ferrovum sp.]NDU88034.1 LysR family transcriptional regulator [Ferrovum sp.]
MHFTFRQLQIFESVARLLSFSRASEELHLTQPAVSMQIKQLEDVVGVPLFEQMGKRVFLTHAGEELYPHTRAIARQMKDAKEALESLREGIGGRLDIAIISTAKYFAPALLSRFCEQYPTVQLKLSVSNRAGIVRQLLHNEVDLVIMGQPPEEMGVVMEPFARNAHIIVAPPHHPLTQKAVVTVTELAREAFLMREKGSGTRQLLERFLLSHGVEVQPRMEMSSNETIKQAAIAGMGIAFLSEHTVTLELETERLKVLPVAGLPIVRDWNLVHHRDKRLSPVARAFKAFLLEQAPQMLPRVG